MHDIGLSLGVVLLAWYGIVFGWLAPGVWLRMETTMPVLRILKATSVPIRCLFWSASRQ